MAFARHINDLAFDDIQALVNSEEPESIRLEYKREIDRSPDGKRELAKDVSAMANSQGGYLIIGIAEEDHRPVMPDEFVPLMLGQQKVEEWLEQILNSNIAQRVDAPIKPIPVPHRAGECIVIIHIPPSPRVPHMVTAQGDNRYYRRYFKRHQFQVLPAEEYEVRDMFERGQRMRDQVKEYLNKHGYFEPEEDPRFAVNKLTRQVGLVDFDETHTLVLEPAHTIVSFVACPTMLQEWIDTSSDEFRRWLDPTKRHYYPPGRFIPYHSSRSTLDGVICRNDLSRDERARLHPIGEYLAVHRNGYVEYGYGDGIQRQGRRLVNFVRIGGRYWQFLAFVRDLYQHCNVPTTAVILLNMANVEGACLYGFGHGWRSMSSMFPPSLGEEQCLEHHIQVTGELDIATFADDDIEQTLREVTARIGDAFGQDRPRCFNSKDDSFPEDLFRGYTD